MTKTDDWRIRMEDVIMKTREDMATVVETAKALKEIVEKHIECQSKIDNKQNNRLDALEKSKIEFWKGIAVSTISIIFTAAVTKFFGLW